MSGSNGVDIPLVIGTEGLDRLVAAYDSMVKFLDAAQAASGGTEEFTKALGGLAKNVQIVRNVLNTDYHVENLNDLARAASKVGKAVSEIDVQRLSAFPKELASAAMSKDVDRLAVALETYKRQIDETRLALDKLSKAQENDAGLTRNDIDRKSAEAEKRLATLETRIATAQRNFDSATRRNNIQDRVDSRQVGREVTAADAQTPGGQAAEAARVAARQREALASGANAKLREAANKANQDYDLEAQTAREVSLGLDDATQKAAKAANKQVDRARAAAVAEAARQQEALASGANVKLREAADNANKEADLNAQAARRAGLGLDDPTQDAAKAANQQVDRERKAAARETARQQEALASGANVKLREAANNDNRQVDLATVAARDVRLGLDDATQNAAKAANTAYDAAQAEAKKLQDMKLRAEEAGLKARANLVAAAEKEDIKRNAKTIADINDAKVKGAIRVQEELAKNLESANNQGDLVAAKRQRDRIVTQRANEVDPEGAPRKPTVPANEGLGDQFTRRAGVLAQYEALGLAQVAIVKTFESVLHLENGLKEVGAISGATATELMKMRNVIIETSTATPFASKEITELAKEMVQAGISSHTVTDSLKSIATLASATGATLKEAGEIFTSSFEVFKLRGAEAARVADQFAVTLDKSRLSAATIGPALQTVSVTAAESGLSLLDLQATLAALANQGLRSGTLLSTGLRQILVDLADPPKKLGDRFRELGLASTDLDVKALGLVGVLDNLKRAGFTTADAFATLPARTAQAFAAFLKSSGDIKTFTEALQNSNGAAAQNAQRMESLENQAKKLGNQFIALTQNGAGPLLGTLKALASGATTVVAALGETGTAFSVVSTIVVGTGVAALVKYLAGLLTIPAAASKVRVAIIAIAEAQTLAAAATGAGTLATALGGPVFLALAAAASVAIGALGLFGNASSTLTAEQERLKTALGETTASIENKEKALEGVNEFLAQTSAKEKALEKDQDLLNKTVSEARSRFGDLSSAVSGTTTTFQGLIRKVQDLRTELRSGLIADIVLARNQLRDLNAENATRVAAATGPNAVSKVLRVAGVPLGAPNEMGALSPELKAVLDGQGASLLRGDLKNNEAVKTAFDILGGKGPPPTADGVNHSIEAVGRMDDKDKVVREAIITGLRAIAAPLADTMQNNARDASLGRASATSEFTRRDDYKALATGFEGVQPDFASLNSLKDIKSVSERSKVGNETISRINAEIKKVDEYRKTLSQEGKDAFEDTDLSKSIDSLRSKVKTTQDGLAAEVIKQTISVADLAAKTTSREYNELQERLRNTHNATDRAMVVAELNKKTNEMAEQKVTVAKARSEKDASSSGDDPEVRAGNLKEDLIAIEAERVTQSERIVRADVEFKVSELKKDIENLLARERTANTRNGKGKLGTASERAELFNQVRSKLTELGELRGESKEDIARSIDTAVNQRELRQGASGGSPRKAPNFNKPFTDTTKTDGKLQADDITAILKEAETASLETRIPLSENKARLDAAKGTDEFPKSRIRQLQKEQNALQITQEEQEVKIRQAETVALLASRDAIKEDTARNQALLVKLIADNHLVVDLEHDSVTPSGLMSEEERADLERRYKTFKQNLSSLQTQDDRALAALDKNAVTVKKLQSEADARKETTPDGLGGVSQGLKDGLSGFNEKSGLNDSVARSTGDMFQETLAKSSSAFSAFITNLETGSNAGKTSFRGLVTSLLQDAEKIINNKIASSLVNGIIGGAMSLLPGGGTPAPLAAGQFGPTQPGQSFATDAAPSVMSGVGAAVTGVGSFIAKQFAYQGGIMRYAGGTDSVPGVDFGRDSVPALLAPGEGVLNRRAVSMIGSKNVNNLNAGVFATQSTMPPPPAPREPDQVSVYIQDKNVVPTLGPRDILAAVHKDILENGATKKLIQQVSIGAR